MQLEPSVGQLAGGTLVTLRGTGFREDAVVLFDGRIAPEIQWRGAGELVALTPPGAGRVDVAVLHGPRTHSLLRGAFTYQGASRVDLHSVRPNSVGTDGGAEVLVRGAGFDETSSVFFDGTPSPSVHYLSPLVLRAVAPAAQAGPSTVTVRTGQDSDSLFQGFEFVEKRLAVTQVSPASASAVGGAQVRISGSYFTPSTQVV